MRAWVVAPESGDYRFFVTGEYRVELFFSPDEGSLNKKRICYVDGWAAYNDWFYKTHLKSAVIRLEAGQRYYLEVLAKSEGQRNLAQVGWTTPSQGTPSLIPSSQLIAFGAEDDADDDLMADAWEQEHFGNLEAPPQQDPDQDGLTNLQEFRNSLNPSLSDSDGNGRSDAGEVTGHLTYDVWLDQSSSTAQAFLNSPGYQQAPRLRLLVGSGNEPGTLQRNYIGILRGYLVPATTGTYKFELRNARDNFALYLSTGESPENKQLLTTKTYQQISRSLQAGQRYYVELVHKTAEQPYPAQLYWVKPGTTSSVPVDPVALRALDQPGLPPQEPLPSPGLGRTSPSTAVGRPIPVPPNSKKGFSPWMWRH
ncbi:MAG: hypothetical protein HC904_04410 [Blastochloris sp.]|nr:hypothetical protein [Blastochloris sp.]